MDTLLPGTETPVADARSCLHLVSHFEKYHESAQLLCTVANVGAHSRCRPTGEGAPYMFVNARSSSRNPA
jgi:hypothetical protein